MRQSDTHPIGTVVRPIRPQHRGYTYVVTNEAENKGYIWLRGYLDGHGDKLFTARSADYEVVASAARISR